LAVASEKDVPTVKALLEALAKVDPDLGPAVVSLVMQVPIREGFLLDLGPWRTATEQIISSKRGSAAPVLRQRVRMLLPYLANDEVAKLVLEMVDALAALAPDESNAGAIAEVLDSKFAGPGMYDGPWRRWSRSIPEPRPPFVRRSGGWRKRKMPTFLSNWRKPLPACTINGWRPNWLR